MVNFNALGDSKYSYNPKGLPAKYKLDNPNNKTFARISSAKTEIPQKTIPTASARYFQQATQSRRLENAARTKSTGYRPLKNNIPYKKGGFERAIDRIGELAEKKAKLTQQCAKVTEKSAKLLEYCKKYGKIFKV